MRETSIPGLLSLGRQALEKAICRLAEEAAGPLLLVDATCGNGHDTLFLAETLHRLGLPGRVLAFDVQEQALAKARSRLAEAGLENRADFLAQGHETLGRHIRPGEVLAAAMFNLGYLPGSDKKVVTGADTTLAALAALARTLRPGGMVSVHVYTGHAGGDDEGAAVKAWFEGLSYKAWVVGRYAICNKVRNREALYLAEKL